MFSVLKSALENLLTHCTTFSGSEMVIWLHSLFLEFSFPQKPVETESKLLVMSVMIYVVTGQRFEGRVYYM